MIARGSSLVLKECDTANRTRHDKPRNLAAPSLRDGGVSRSKEHSLTQETWHSRNVVMDPFIGTIMAVGFNFAPRGWATCDGQLLAINQNTALFSLLGTMYGGDGRNNFALPDLRGRVAVHQGSLAKGGGMYKVGSIGGAETVTLTTAQMPGHTHQVKGQSAAGNTDGPGSAVPAAIARSNIYSDRAPNVDMEAAMLTATGGGGAHENRPPYLVVNWVIALQGIFPSRS